MQKYISQINDKRFNLIITEQRGRVVFRSKSRGIRDLFWCSKSGLLKNSFIFDIKIGLAAAKLAYWSGTKNIYARQISQAAYNFLQNNHLRTIFHEKLDYLYGKNDTQACLIEKSVMKTTNLNNLYSVLEDLIFVQYEKTPADGIFPTYYFTTSNRTTYINLSGKWIKVKNIEMDKAIHIDQEDQTATCICAHEVKKGDLIAIGELYQGIKEENEIIRDENRFRFMSSTSSGERPKEVLIGNVAEQMQRVKNHKKRILFVVGPAVIHTGASRYLALLIKNGFVDVLFGGNAIATHDLEQNYMGTSLGVDLSNGCYTVGGNHNHLRTINLIRFCGGIRNFINKGFVRSGIFYECIKNNVSYILAGSIRDDGPITDVVTDSVKAQMAMRYQTRRGFGMAVMIATTLHSVATGNLLPADVIKIIVDDNLGVVTKLADRGTNATGIVTDCAFFLSELCRQLNIISC